MNDKGRDSAKDRTYDPRSVSDAAAREEVSRKTVARWQREAESAHNHWLEIIQNRYGKDD